MLEINDKLYRIDPDEFLRVIEPLMTAPLLRAHDCGIWGEITVYGTLTAFLSADVNTDPDVLEAGQDFVVAMLAETRKHTFFVVMRHCHLATKSISDYTRVIGRFDSLYEALSATDINIARAEGLAPPKLAQEPHLADVPISKEIPRGIGGT